MEWTGLARANGERSGQGPVQAPFDLRVHPCPLAQLGPAAINRARHRKGPRRRALVRPHQQHPARQPPLQCINESSSTNSNPKTAICRDEQPPPRSKAPQRPKASQALRMMPYLRRTCFVLVGTNRGRDFPRDRSLRFSYALAGSGKRFRRRVQERLRELHRAPPRKLQNDLVVPQALAALDEAEIADDAVIAATHASESCSPELIAHTREHPRSMHCLLIPSNLDGDRIILSRATRLTKSFIAPVIWPRCPPLLETIFSFFPDANPIEETFIGKNNYRSRATIRGLPRLLQLGRDSPRLQACGLCGR
jgi:hypothetical protein